MSLNIKAVMNEAVCAARGLRSTEDLEAMERLVAFEEVGLALVTGLAAMARQYAAHGHRDAASELEYQAKAIRSWLWENEGVKW